MEGIFSRPNICAVMDESDACVGLRTIAGYEAIHMIRKGQAYGSASGAKVGLL
jgi:hypothetical protein